MPNRNSACCAIEDTPLSLPREGAATVVLGYRGMNLLKVMCRRNIRNRPRRSEASLYAGAEGPSTPGIGLARTGVATPARAHRRVRTSSVSDERALQTPNWSQPGPTSVRPGWPLRAVVLSPFKASERKLATDDREQPQCDRNQA